MDLKTFVSETLCQIQEGVEDAIKRRASTSGRGVINPQYSQYQEATKEIIEKVSFDVAVTVSEGEEMGGKAGLRVYGIGADLQSSGKRESESVSRVQFSIPMVPPTTIVEQDRTAALQVQRDENTRRMIELARRNSQSIA